MCALTADELKEAQDEAFKTAIERALNMRYGLNAMKLPKCYPIQNPIEKVIFNPPATIVFWKSGDKTVVKSRGDDEFNPEIGLAMAISKHYLCNICGLKRYDGVFNKYVPKEKTKIESVPSMEEEFR